MASFETGEALDGEPPEAVRARTSDHFCEHSEPSWFRNDYNGGNTTSKSRLRTELFLCSCGTDWKRPQINSRSKCGQNVHFLLNKDLIGHDQRLLENRLGFPRALPSPGPRIGLWCPSWNSLGCLGLGNLRFISGTQLVECLSEKG